jgi:hypothetical protein
MGILIGGRVSSINPLAQEREGIKGLFSGQIEKLRPLVFLTNPAKMQDQN